MKTFIILAFFAGSMAHVSLAAQPSANPFDTFLGSYRVIGSDCGDLKDTCEDVAEVKIEYIEQNGNRALFATEVWKTGGHVSSPMVARDDRDANGQGGVSKFDSPTSGMASWTESVTFGFTSSLLIRNFLTSTRQGATHSYCESKHFWDDQTGRQSNSSRCFYLVKE